MTFAEGVILCILGTTITLIGLAIAYHIGSDHRKEDEEIKARKKWRKLVSWWD